MITITLRYALKLRNAAGKVIINGPGRRQSLYGRYPAFLHIGQEVRKPWVKVFLLCWRARHFWAWCYFFSLINWDVMHRYLKLAGDRGG